MKELLEIIKILTENPVNKQALQSAKLHEDRIKFHTQTVVDANKVSAAQANFFRWVGDLIPEERVANFKALFKNPVETISVTSEAFDFYKKVFDGCDPVYTTEFVKPELSEDWNTYRFNELDYPDKWRNEAFEKLRTSINSVIIVDLPTESDSNMSAPYFYFLDIREVIDFEADEKGKIVWIAFKQPEDKIAWFDSETLRIYQSEKGDYSKLTELSNVKHEFGECPAKFFWTDSISHEEPFVKASPISAQLSYLDWMLFYFISKRYADIYVPWTIFWGYVSKCNYKAPYARSGYVTCQGGYLMTDKNVNLLTTTGAPQPCPICAKKIAGAGAFIDVKPPSDGKQGLVPPAGTIDVDVDGLKYNVEEIERLTARFMQLATGNPTDIVNNQAINVDQVLSILETGKTKLNSIKANFEAAQHWTDTLLCKGRYGKDFVSLNLSYGTEYYFLNADLILAAYQKAKSENASAIILDLLEDQYFATKYKNNPTQLARTKMIANIDPFRHLSNDEMKDIKETVGAKLYMLKINLSTYISRFERENGSIVNFGSIGTDEGGKPYTFSKRIDLIKEELLSYVESEVAKEKLPEA